MGGESFGTLRLQKETVLRNAPVLYRLLCEYSNHFTSYLPVPVVDLMEAILELTATYQRQLPFPSHFTEFTDIRDDEYYKTGMYYPGMPILRTVPSYMKDVAATSDSACNKHYPAASSGETPGIFKIFCMQCQRQIGFHVQKWAESCRTPFEIIRSRWTEAPELICYDNACNLCNYFMSREPMWSSKTKLIIDKLHVRGHCTCSPAHDPYVNHLLLEGLGTQRCEQSNATHSDTFRTQTFFMTQSIMFLFHVRLHMYFHLMRTFDL